MRSKGRIDILKPSSNDGTIVSGFEKLSIYKENDGSHNGLSVTHGAGVVAKVWDSENDGPGSGLNADLLDGKHYSDIQSDIQNAKTENFGYRYAYFLVMYGDHDKYYPFAIAGGDQNVKRDILIKRSYSELHPPEWYLSTHGGGLTLKIRANFGSWGGANYGWEIHELEQMYNETFAGAEMTTSYMTFSIFLRGGGVGGAIYHVYSNQPIETNSPLHIEGQGTSGNFPMVFYNSETVRYQSSQYAWVMPSYRATPSTEEIRIRKFIKLTQDNDTRILGLENQSINYDLSAEPTETGTKNKTANTLWQNLFNHTNFLWLKLKGLFPLTQATTDNFLPKIDNLNKKLVRSNISDDGSTVKIDSPLDLKGNQIKNVAIEVVSSLPATNIVGRRVTYQGRDYIYNGSEWVPAIGEIITINNGYGVTFSALENGLYTNKLWCYDTNKLSFENSQDGVNFTTINPDLTQLKKILTNYNPEVISCSLGTANAFRITIEANANPYRVLLEYLVVKAISYVNPTYIKIESSIDGISWNTIINNLSWEGGWPGECCINTKSLYQFTHNTGFGHPFVRITFSYNTGVTWNFRLNSLRWYGSFSYNQDFAAKNTPYDLDYDKNVYFPASVISNQTINFNINNEEPTQSGNVTKTSTWLWQYLVQSMNYSWLKLKTWVGGLFSAGSVTTNNHYLPKIDDVNKKLVKSNINDDGTTPKYGANTIWHSGNDGSGSGLDADLLDGWHVTQLANTHIHNELQWRHQTGYAGIEITGYKIVMLNAITNKFEPLTIGDTANTTKTVNTSKFLLNSPILYNNDYTAVAANTLLGSSFYIYGTNTKLDYTSNSTGLNNGQPLYLKGIVNDKYPNTDGTFQLDNTTLTSWLTQALPTSNDGFVYILLGIINNGNLVMLPYHPIYKYTPNGIRIYTPGGVGSGNDADLIWGTDAKTFVEDAINLNTNVAKYPNGLSFNPQSSRTFDFSSNNYYDGTAYTLVDGSATYTIANPVLGKIMYIALPPKPTSFNITFTPNVKVIGTPSSGDGKTNLIRITCINDTAPKYIAEILVH